MTTAKINKYALLADQVIVSGGTLATQLLIAAGLGMAQYGRFSVLVLVQLFLLSLQQAGLSGMYQVLYPGMAPGVRKRYAAGTWAAELLFLLAIALIALLGYPFFRLSFPFMEWIAYLVNVLLFLLQDFFRRIFITGNQVRALLTIDLSNNLLQVTALALLFRADQHNLQPVLWVCGLSFLPGLLQILRPVQRPRFDEVRPVLKQHGTEAVWMTAAALLQWFAGNFYIIAAGWWLGAATLGILRLGQYCFGLLNILLQAVESYLLPRTAALAAVPGTAIRYLKGAQFKIILGTGLLLVLVLALSQPILNRIHTGYPAGVTTVLYGMSLLYLFIAGGYPVRIALRTLKLSRFFFTGFVLAALFGFSTAHFFIHQWSLAGVVAGLLCSQLLLLGYWIYILQHKYSVLWS